MDTRPVVRQAWWAWCTLDSVDHLKLSPVYLVAYPSVSSFFTIICMRMCVDLRCTYLLGVLVTVLSQVCPLHQGQMRNDSLSILWGRVKGASLTAQGTPCYGSHHITRRLEVQQTGIFRQPDAFQTPGSTSMSGRAQTPQACASKKNQTSDPHTPKPLAAPPGSSTEYQALPGVGSLAIMTAAAAVDTATVTNSSF